MPVFSVIVILLKIERQRKIWYNLAANWIREMKISEYFKDLKNNDSERLGTEPIKPLLLSMATPSVIAMLMQAFYNKVPPG